MPGEARAQASLDHDHVAGVADVENRHPRDRARGVGVRQRVHHVVGADDDRHVALRERGVDLVHFLELVVRHVGLGQQHVHVPRHAAGDGVNGVLDRACRAASSSVASSRTVCWAWATARP